MLNHLGNYRCLTGKSPPSSPSRSRQNVPSASKGARPKAMAKIIRQCEATRARWTDLQRECVADWERMHTAELPTMLECRLTPLGSEEKALLAEIRVNAARKEYLQDRLEDTNETLGSLKARLEQLEQQGTLVEEMEAEVRLAGEDVIGGH